MTTAVEVNGHLIEPPVSKLDDYSCNHCLRIWTRRSLLPPSAIPCVGHPDDCLYCAAGEAMRHNYEPPVEGQ